MLGAKQVQQTLLAVKTISFQQDEAKMFANPALLRKKLKTSFSTTWEGLQSSMWLCVVNETPRAAQWASESEGKKKKQGALCPVRHCSPDKPFCVLHSFICNPSLTHVTWEEEEEKRKIYGGLKKERERRLTEIERK